MSNRDTADSVLRMIEDATLGCGWNGQPGRFFCAGTEACRVACGKLCVHAEARAIRAAVTVARGDIDGLELVHAKVVDGELVAGGGPSCWQCSREILDAGIAAVWLYETGDPKLAPWADLYRPPGTWRRYTAEDFHRATAAACGLAVSEGG